MRVFDEDTKAPCYGRRILLVFEHMDEFVYLEECSREMGWLKANKELSEKLRKFHFIPNQIFTFSMGKILKTRFPRNFNICFGNW